MSSWESITTSFPSGDGGCDVPLAIVDGVDETMGDTLVELFVGATLGGVDETNDTVAELFVGDRLSGVDKTRGDTLAELFVGDALDGVDKTVGGDVLLVEPNIGSTALAVAEVTIGDADTFLLKGIPTFDTEAAIEEILGASALTMPVAISIFNFSSISLNFPSTCVNLLF